MGQLRKHLTVAGQMPRAKEEHDAANPAKGLARRPRVGGSGQVPQRGHQWRDRGVYARHAGRDALRPAQAKSRNGTLHGRIATTVR